MRTTIHVPDKSPSELRIIRYHVMNNLHASVLFFPEYVESRKDGFRLHVKGYYWTLDNELILYSTFNLEVIISRFTDHELTTMRNVYTEDYHVF